MKNLVCFLIFILSLNVMADQSAHSNFNDDKKSWNILLYMAADNDLTPFALWDIYEMERKFKDENLINEDDINVIVELDTLKNDGQKRYLIKQTQKLYDKKVNKEFFIKNYSKTISSKLLSVENESTPSAVRFENFLIWAQQNFPAENTMVVIWGHGEGYIGDTHNKNLTRPPLKPNKPNSSFLLREEIEIDLGTQFLSNTFPVDKVIGGVAFDYSDKTFLTIPAIKDTLNELKENYRNGKPIDILAFDSCLMQSIEVAFELKEVTRFIVGSSQIQNFTGLPYRLIIDQIKNRPDITPYELVKAIPELSKESYNSGNYQDIASPEAKNTITTSSLSTSELNLLLLPALKALSKSLLEYMEEDQFREIEIGFLVEHSPHFMGETKDIGILMGGLKKLLYNEKRAMGEFTEAAKKLNTKIDLVMSSLQRTMMNYAFGELYIQERENFLENYLLGFFKAISIWLPSNRELFQHRIQEFRESELFKNAQGWNSLLTHLYR